MNNARRFEWEGGKEGLFARCAFLHGGRMKLGSHSGRGRRLRRQHPCRHQDDSQHDDSARLRILAVVACTPHSAAEMRSCGLTEIIEPAAFARLARLLARCAMLNRIRSLPSLASPPRANEQHSLFTPQMAHTRLKGHVALHTRGLPYMTFK